MLALGPVGRGSRAGQGQLLPAIRQALSGESYEVICSWSLLALDVEANGVPTAYGNSSLPFCLSRPALTILLSSLLLEHTPACSCLRCVSALFASSSTLPPESHGASVSRREAFPRLLRVNLSTSVWYFPVTSSHVLHSTCHRCWMYCLLSNSPP